MGYSFNPIQISGTQSYYGENDNGSHDGLANYVRKAIYKEQCAHDEKVIQLKMLEVNSMT